MAQTIIDTHKPDQDGFASKTSAQESCGSASATETDRAAYAEKDGTHKPASEKTCACAVGDLFSGAWVKRTFPGHEHSVIGGVVGLVVACLIFTLGLMRVLVILLCVALGIAAGQIADGNPKLMRMVRNFFRDKRI